MDDTELKQQTAINSNIDEKHTNSTELVTVDTTTLNSESLAILNEIIAAEATDTTKTKDLTYLFNANQTKKTMVRLDSLSNLQDKLVGLLSKRVIDRPDEMSNQEVMQGLKIVQDIMDRSTKNITGVDPQTPLIQINQQDNSVNMGAGIDGASRESKNRVKNAVMSLLSSINDAANDTDATIDISDHTTVNTLGDTEDD